MDEEPRAKSEGNKVVVGDRCAFCVWFTGQDHDDAPLCTFGTEIFENSWIFLESDERSG